jgi:hypothetical protein
MIRHSIVICFLLYTSTLLADYIGVNVVASATTPYDFISLNTVAKESHEKRIEFGTQSLLATRRYFK